MFTYLNTLQNLEIFDNDIPQTGESSTAFKNLFLSSKKQ